MNYRQLSRIVAENVAKSGIKPFRDIGCKFYRLRLSILRPLYSHSRWEIGPDAVGDSFYDGVDAAFNLTRRHPGCIFFRLPWHMKVEVVKEGKVESKCLSRRDTDVICVIPEETAEKILVLFSPDPS